MPPLSAYSGSTAHYHDIPRPRLACLICFCNLSIAGITTRGLSTHRAGRLTGDATSDTPLPADIRPAVVFPCAHLVCQPCAHQLFRTATHAQPPSCPCCRFRLVFNRCGYAIRGITAPLIAGECGSCLLPTPLPPVPPSCYDFAVAKINDEGRRTHDALEKIRAARDALETIAIPGVVEKARDLAFTVRNHEQSLRRSLQSAQHKATYPGEVRPGQDNVPAWGHASSHHP
ncbi:hypothetical protein SEUCBS139899_003798 [Sporothrix eucalyptigena]|uniref:RING-type domain-containing protein n=1 Tax=Sporothrix eucalyptigena TaxID=1812306 RepID=A0ABP0BE72_9PEZI